MIKNKLNEHLKKYKKEIFGAKPSYIDKRNMINTKLIEFMNEKFKDDEDILLDINTINAHRYSSKTIKAMLFDIIFNKQAILLKPNEQKNNI